MLLDLRTLVDRYGVRIDGVLHAGAHLGEEAPQYQQLGVENVWWIEANPHVLDKLQRNLHPYSHELIHALLWSEAGVELGFNITNCDGMSSSVLEFGTHPAFSPEMVFEDRVTLVTSTIDSLADERGITANFLNMDLQGVEGHVLRGAERFLAGVDYVMTEVNKEEVYVGCTRIQELDALLDRFDRVETVWVAEQGWGDAFYVRRR